jgi:hypothetical protein
MPWKSSEPDPLKQERRRLEEQQRELAAKARQLQDAIAPGPDGKVRLEPPVWRDDNIPDGRAAEPTPARKRHLARQRQRDMFFAIGLVLLLVVVLGMLLWVAYVHNTATVSGG